MIVQQKRYRNLNTYLKTLFYFIFNWSVYPLISSTKSGPLPELEVTRGCHWSVHCIVSFKLPGLGKSLPRCSLLSLFQVLQNSWSQMFMSWFKALSLHDHHRWDLKKKKSWRVQQYLSMHVSPLAGSVPNKMACKDFEHLVGYPCH